MEVILKAILLGIVQGLAEFLPISSSGHIELGKALTGIDFGEDNLSFSIILHIATVLSTIIVFRNDIVEILKDLFKFEWNDSTKFAANVLLSMIPVLLVGIFLKDWLETFFDGKIVFVGCMLLLTGLLLLSTKFIKQNDKPITPLKAFLIGVSQAIAVLPGISRSGATISTGLLLSIDKGKLAKFSFLMVIPPILGAMLLDIKDIVSGEAVFSIEPSVIIAGFLAAFITGLVACNLMISIVKKGKIQYFAYYCFIVGFVAIGSQWI